MAYDKILSTVDDGIATITLNFPEKRNAMRAPMVAELGQALALAEHDEGVKAVILTGAGEHFSAGGDMGAGATMTTETALARMNVGSHQAQRLVEFRKPVVAAAVDGVAFSFALAADLVIASSRARFCMAFMRMGLVPDAAALFTLPRMVGMQRARELIYTTRELDAAAAHDWGLVLEVVEPVNLQRRSVEVARAMGSLSGVAFGLTKAALLRSNAADLGAMINNEIQAQTIAFNSAYAAEVGQRFRERQPLPFHWPAAVAAAAPAPAPTPSTDA